MTVGIIRMALALAAVAGMAVAARELIGPGVQVALPEPHLLPAGSGHVTEARPDPKLIERALQRPPFRGDRRRAGTAYDGSRPAVPDTPPPATPKPLLALSGIVWGPEPAALVEGVPGIEGSAVFRRGDSLAGLRVTRIDRDRVVIRGMDTTWNLTVRNPWP